jgi:tripartite-type tricarboxylate transporter receptor subunit TctC
MEPDVLFSRWVPVLIALTAFAVLCPAHAQPASAGKSWPSKPIKVVVDLPPGSTSDLNARTIAVPLQEALSQPVVVENRSGANGMIGGDHVAKSSPDGYTLLVTPGSMVAINPHLYPKMPFDPVKDLVPVAAVMYGTVLLVARPDLPVKNIKDFLAYAKANPGKLTYGSAGSGSGLHLAAEMLKRQAGLSAVHVPFRGGAPALQALLAGQVDFNFDAGIALNQIRSGKVRLLAIGSLKRTPVFPDVPTLEEAGLPGFNGSTTSGFYAPAGTPAEVIARLNHEINAILRTQSVRDRFAALGVGQLTPMSPAEFGAAVQEDSKRFGALIRELNIKAD